MVENRKNLCTWVDENSRLLIRRIFSSIFGIAYDYTFGFYKHGFKRRQKIFFTNSEIEVTLGEIIAEGGYSYVYLATDQKGTKYAVKKVLIQSEELKKSIDDEVNFMKNISHPNLLKLIDVKRSPHENYVNFYNTFLLLPFIDQGSIESLLQKMSKKNIHMSEKRICGIFLRVCDALKALHKMQPPMAHRDIKLGNILLDSTETPFLMDFGSVAPARISIKTRSDALKLQDWAESHCTNVYRAPELFDCPSEIDIDERTDIWSLGCVLYGMAFGKSPFEESSINDSVKLAVTSGSFDMCQNQSKLYSKEFLSLIQSMLRLEITERPFIDKVINDTELILKKFDK